MDRDLMILGEELAEHQNAFVRERLNLPRGRARLLACFAQPPATRRIYRVLAIAGMLFYAAAMGFFLRGPFPGYHVGMLEHAGKTGEWIAAPSNSVVPLSFDDGTKLILQANGRARITEVVAHGATVIVERGALLASVQPHAGNRWRVDVGPFRVTVVGTQFDVSWQPDVERFSLTLRKGEVTVAGPVVGARRSVRAGEQLDVWVAQSRLTSSRIEEAASCLVVVEPAAKPAASASAANVFLYTKNHALEDAGTAMPSNPSLDEFRSLARANRYRDALSEVEHLGFEALCSSASATDVLLLGDVARLAGDVARAQEAYWALRHRFVGGPAAHGAFMLGRIAHDQRGAYAEAAEYFATYLHEAPAGVFAREAASRLVESRTHSGDLDGAKAAAARYLESYPSGPYADRAKEVLTVP